MSARILVTARSFGSGDRDLVAELHSEGHTVVRAAAHHDVVELRPILPTVDAWIAGTGPVTRELLEMAPQLKVVARYGVGVDAVDIEAARELGIRVANTPQANSQAVAEHALALMFSVLRNIPAGDRDVRSGNWKAVRGRQIGGLKIGILGYGAIGRRFARAVAALGAQVSVHDPFVEDEEIEAKGYCAASLEQIRDESEVVSLHIPGAGLVIDSRWVESCRPGQLIVNTSRANLVDEHAVARSLTDGRLAGLAADTLATESAHGEGSVLLSPELERCVVVTPHVAAQTVEAVDAMGSMATDCAIAVLQGRAAPFPVV